MMLRRKLAFVRVFSFSFRRLARTMAIVGIFLMSSLSFAENDFENFDEEGAVDDFNETDGADDEMPDIEAEQDDIRMEKTNGIGVSIGEMLPYTTLLFEYYRNIDPATAIFFAVGRGALNSSLQEEGEDLALNKISTFASEIGYAKWFSQSFPVAATGLASFIRSDGSITGQGIKTGQHRMDSLGLGGDLRLHTFFENGFWLKWSLISFRYLRVISETHSNYSSSQLTSSRQRFSKFKILGVTNITIGYAW